MPRRSRSADGHFDPIRVAVDQAVAAFSSGKNEAGRKKDRDIWLKIANRAGLDAFLDAFDQKTSESEKLEREHRCLRSPASSFQKLLRGYLWRGRCDCGEVPQRQRPLLN